MILILAGWCAGLAAGSVLLSPAAAAPALGATAVTLGVALTATLGSRAGPHHLAILLAPALLLCGLARGAAAVHVAGPATVDYYYGHHVSLVGTAVRSSAGAAYQSLRLAALTMQGRPLAGTVQVTARSPVPVVPGSVLRATGVLERLPGRAYDGSTGYDDRMERQGVLAAMPAATFQVIAPPGRWSLPAMAWRLRTAIAAGTRARVPEPEATILLGEMVGIRGKLPVAVESDLVDSGLVHVLAVSGLKVAVVAGFLVVLLRRAGRRAALLAIAGIFVYAVVGGASSAALRSALMGSLGLLAQVLRRDVDPLRSLLMAASVMLGLNPELASDLSFQYSFLGVLGIQLLHPVLGPRLHLVPPPFREALAVSLAAQLATLPLTAAYFHVVPLGGPLVNTLAVPFIGPTMAAGAWVASGWPGANGIVLVFAAGSAATLLQLAHLGAAAPGAVLRLPWFGSTAAITGYSVAAFLWAAARAGRLRGRLIAAAVPAAAVVALLLALPDGRMHLVFLDTPGGGVLVTAPDGARMLVDAGASAPILAKALDTMVGPLGPNLDTLLLTGSGRGVSAGIGGLGSRRPGLVLIAAEAPGAIPARVAGGLAQSGSAVRGLVPGDLVHWHGLDLATGSCGQALAISVRYGQNVAWICDAGDRADPGTLPAGGLAAVDIGDGKIAPDGDLGGAAWVVDHAGGSARGDISAAALGPRLWRTARDGALALGCDSRACSR